MLVDVSLRFSIGPEGKGIETAVIGVTRHQRIGSALALKEKGLRRCIDVERRAQLACSALALKEKGLRPHVHDSFDRFALQVQHWP